MSPTTFERDRFRPCCSFCGFEDGGTFTRTQLDVYDFACPTCPAGGYIQLRREPDLVGNVYVDKDPRGGPTFLVVHDDPDALHVEVVDFFSGKRRRKIKRDRLGRAYRFTHRKVMG